MLTVYSEDHRLQNGAVELVDGRLQRPVEKPARADTILAAILDAKLGDVIAPRGFTDAAITRVHDTRFVLFLASAWQEWREAHGEWDALPGCILPSAGRDLEPATIDGKLAYFASDPGTPITSGTWRAARSAAHVALTGAALMAEGHAAAFGLCRPPGHHASRRRYGGFCFLNNAAIAAQSALDAGAHRVSILDVDYHHGNGTQSIFYDRSDVLFVSLHADPSAEYPFSNGFADETGEGAGEGFNLNLPLPRGTDWAGYQPALAMARARIAEFAPDLLVVSLGVDTFEGDPIAGFRLGSNDFMRLGQEIARCRAPTLFLLEGGYAVDAIGRNVVNVLAGFEAGDA